jgi:hypothetical protein
MPVNELIVEGDLDAEIMQAVLEGEPVVKRGGSKSALKPQARQKRTSESVLAAYLRDRDFDFEPPEDRSVAVVDSTHKDQPLGWRWVRHEIENYLIDPLIVEAALGIPSLDWSDVLTEVASRIRWYQIARWTIGEARRSLPPHYELCTRPPELGERLGLLDDLEENACLTWCRGGIGEYLARISCEMCSEKVAELIAARTARLSVSCLEDVGNVLVWCSGKDLLAGLPQSALDLTGTQTPGELRTRLRSWIRKNSKDAIACFPEWQNLIEQVRA